MNLILLRKLSTQKRTFTLLKPMDSSEVHDIPTYVQHTSSSYNHHINKRKSLCVKDGESTHHIQWFITIIHTHYTLGDESHTYTNSPSQSMHRPSSKLFLNVCGTLWEKKFVERKQKKNSFLNDSLFHTRDSLRVEQILIGIKMQKKKKFIFRI